MNEKNKNRLFIGAVILGLFIAVPFLMEPTEYEDTYDNAVNIFPEKADAKNYRLTAKISTKIHYRPFFTYDKEYKVHTVMWPNGGWVDVDCGGATLRKGESKNCTVGDDAYRVELNDPDSYPSY